MGVKDKALQAIRREHMLSPDCAVVAGVSGGADSVTLLHILLSLRQEGAIKTLVAVHVNHSLRGEESKRDQQFVETLCRKWDVPLYVEQHNVAKLAAQQGKGLEEVGRELRYAAFQKAAQKYPCYRIATAHNADDNAETLLLHLCRGSGLHGSAGIPPVRGNIIRPLITCTREEIETYCVEQGLTYVIDSTNADITYARNRVRHAVMPQLREINPKAIDAITRFIEQVRQTNRFLDKLIDKAVADSKLTDPDTYCRKTLLSLEEPIRSGSICRIVKTAEDRHVRLMLSVLEKGRGAVVLPTGVRWAVTECVLTAQTVADESYPFFCFSATVGNSYTIGENIYRLTILSKAEYEQKLNICKYVFQNAFDYDKIKGALFLRQRQEGDRFRPVGRKCSKSLKKMFNEQKAAFRDRIPILCDESGVILVYGFGCDERVRITPDTKTVLWIAKEEDIYDDTASGC